MMSANAGSEKESTERWELRLYIAGQNEKTARALSNVRAICDSYLGTGIYHLEVVDVVESPLVAEREQILAVPMLVRRSPKPTRKIVGDLSDRDVVLIALNLEAARGR